MKRFFSLIATVGFGLAPMQDGRAVVATPTEVFVYFGTYTRGSSEGIYLSRLDLKTGHLSKPVLAAAAPNPAFLAVHPNKQFLYSVAEQRQDGGVLAFRIGADGGLTLVNRQSSGGAGPTHLVVDRAGKNVLVANYGGGSVACLPISDDGGLKPFSAFVQHKGSSVHPSRQTAPHAHGIYADPKNRYVFVPDLGMDRVVSYKFDADRGTLDPNEPGDALVAPGSGPRHFAFRPDGRFAYVINEMVCTMTAFRYDSVRGRLDEIQTVSTLPDGVAVEPGYSTAEVFVHPAGRFLYGSNRGHDTIAVFSIDPEEGVLSLVENAPAGTEVPRGFGIDPTGQFLIVGGQRSDTVAVLRIDRASGKLTPTGQTISVGSPVCVEFLIR